MQNLVSRIPYRACWKLDGKCPIRSHISENASRQLQGFQKYAFLLLVSPVLQSSFHVKVKLDYMEEQKPK